MTYWWLLRESQLSNSERLRSLFPEGREADQVILGAINLSLEEPGRIYLSDLAKRNVLVPSYSACIVLGFILLLMKNVHGHMHPHQ